MAASWRVGALALFLSAARLFAQGEPDFELPEEKALRERSPDAAATLVVFNTNDPESGDLARFYAEKRGIPKQQILGITCAVTEEITREEYDLHIAEPLRRAFTSNFWWKLRGADHPLGPVEANRIRYIALMRGIPLKIASTVAYPGDKPFGPSGIADHNEAAVDSELSVLGLNTRVISGLLINPYYRSFRPIREALRPDLLLVCRLDAPSAAIVRRMIIDSIAAEKNGLYGFAYIDARGITDPGYVDGDRWLIAAALDARKQGVPVILDQGPGLFPEGYPMEHAALYFGWYSEQLSGPFMQPGFRFQPGALAVHIHSFSASTLRDPHRNWCAPLLVAGAAATLGSVYEPYLEFTPHLDVFYGRLRSGFNFAESAYMSQRGLSWMTTFVGDPLYRPFPLVPETINRGNEWTAYKRGALQWFVDRASGESVLRQTGRRLHSGVVFEGLGLLELTVNASKDALEAFEQARKYYPDLDDRLRVVIHEVILLKNLKRESEAEEMARREIADHPAAPGSEVLRQLIAPPPPPPAPAEPTSAAGGGRTSTKQR